MSPDVLEPELKYFQQNKPELLKTHLGQFVLIKDCQMAGAFTTFDEAFNAGVAKFGNAPFLVKQVLEKEPIEKIPALMHNLLHAGI